MNDDLHYLPATEALRRFRTRELSPVELLDAVIARAEAVEPAVNAFAWTRFDEAREEAKAAEIRYGGRGAEPRPLEGLPVGIKDEMPIAGQPFEAGSLHSRGLVAEETSFLARRILDAGAIVHARTTTPEFSCAGFTHTLLNGVTRNPWNLEFGVGGSLRIPASFNGIVAFKAPYGRVPVESPFNLDVFCHNGAMARSVADCALFENVLAGPHPLDHTSLRPKLELPGTFEGVRGLRVALSPALGSWPLDPEVEANTRAVAEALRSAGAIVEEVDLVIDRALVQRAVAIHFNLIFGAWIQSECAAHPDEVNDYAVEFARRMAADSAGAGMLDGLLAEQEVQSRVGAVLDRYDALLCATVGTRGLVAGDGYVGHGLTVGDVELDDYFGSILTPVFNIASRCPVLAVPSGRAGNGVPTGVQLVGRTYDDVVPFRLGAALERVLPPIGHPDVATPATVTSAP